MNTPLLAVLISAVVVLPTVIHAQEDAVLYVTNGTHILREGPKKTFTVLPVTVTLGRVVGLAVDIEANLIFWSDIRFGCRGIYKADLNGLNSKLIVKDVLEVNSLTVDWSVGNLYWTDGRRRTVEVSDYDGKNRRVLVNGKMKQPRGIVADPVNSYLFWNDQGLRVIERARLDGSDRRVIRKMDLHWPNQMVVNWDDRKLMWVDGFNKTLMSSDLGGGNVHQVANLSGQAGDDVVFGLTVKGSTSYVSMWNKGIILAVSSSGSVTTYSTSLGSSVFSLVLKTTSNPRAVSHMCKNKNGGCSHLCLPTSTTTRRCSCPSFGGKSLNAAGTTCVDPTRILVFALGDVGQVCFVDLESPKPYEYQIISWALRPVAVGYDPVNQHVYFSDVFEKRVFRINFDGTEKKVFLDRTFGIGTVDGLLVDWKNRQLFYSNMGFQSVNGYYFTWHKIDMVSLDDSSKRRTIVTDTEKPRALALDSNKGHLYWTDWGINPKLMRVNLDGTNMVTVRSGLDSPNAIILSNDKIYLLDSHYKNNKPPPEPKGSLYAIDKADGSLSEIKGINLKIPFGMTISSDSKIYVSDWKENAVIELTSTQWSSGMVTSKKTLFSDVGQPMGLLYTKRTEGNPDGECSQCKVCLGSGRQKSCSCSSYEGKVLQRDKRTCSVPKNFLAFTDMNSIKMLSLDQPASDRSVYVIQQKDSYRDNYVSIAYDPTEKFLYFSDVNREQIFRSHVDGSGRELFFNASQHIDGMFLNADSRKLYWTASSAGLIASISLSGNAQQTYQVIVGNLTSPRAIQVTNRFIYWTEWGDAPRIARCSLSGTDVKTVISTSTMKFPNALLVTDKTLLYGDGHSRKIFNCSLEGSLCEEIRYITNIPSHIFSIGKVGDFLYYTDWYGHTLSMVNVVTGTVQHVIKNLMRPAQFVIHHPGVPDCPSGHGCSDRCFAYPGGYQCGCLSGRRLISDQKTCEQGVWQITNSSRCADNCTNQLSVCGLQDSTTAAKCICKEGYQGNVQSCEACRPDTYKAHPGPGQCIACPSGSSQQKSGQSSCECENNKKWHDGKCREPSVGDSRCPVAPVTPQCSVSSKCDGSNQCRGGQKCCQWGSCGNLCLEPLRNTTCRVNNKYYNIGMIFFPDPCQICTCETTTLLSGKVAMTKCRETCPKLSGPTFKNCPKELVRLTVPEDSDSVQNIVLQAVDSQGAALSVTYQPSHSYLKWKGLDQKGIYKISASASDKNGRKVTCSYEVLVLDKTPPLVTCPANIEKYTSGFGARVYWEEPVVTDNIAVAPTVTKSHDQGLFLIGTKRVSITAKDDAGNTATCNFLVKVLKKKEEYCDVFDVPRGVMVTSGGSEYSINCVPPNKKHRSIAPSYMCKNGKFEPPLTQTEARSACMNESPLKVKQKLKLKFRGCANNNVYLNEVKESVYRMCSKFSSNVSCRKNQIRAKCQKQGSRVKREDYYTVVDMEVVSLVRTTRGDAVSQLSKYIDDLKKELSEGNQFLSINQQKVNPSLQSDSSALSTGCDPGEVRRENKCYLCNSGTMEKDGTRCELCPADTYQNQAGQTQCLTCPAGMTSQPGSYSSFQCKRAATQSPMPSPPGIPIYAIIGAVVAVVVIIVIIVVVVLVIKRCKRPAGKPYENAITNPAYSAQEYMPPIYETIPEAKVEQSSEYIEPIRAAENHENYEALAYPQEHAGPNMYSQLKTK